MNNRISFNMGLYEKLYLIRRSEEKIVELYRYDHMKTPMHMSMGAEAIAVGVCEALGKEGQVFGSYRSHAIYLAKTGDVLDFFSEMYGKSGALLKGKGGSMHLCAPKHGFMGTSAIVASAIPVAAGAAFANKKNKNKRVVVVFFGDGAIDEGVFWETINVSSLMKLPIIFICEDNGYAVHSPVSQRHGYESITGIIKNFNCSVFSSDTTDVENIYDFTKDALEKMENEKKPVFLHLKYYRYLEHVGIFEDFNAGYRAEEEFKEWKKKDPVSLQREKLRKLGCPEKEIRVKEENIVKQINSSITKAEKDAFASPDILYEEVL